MLERVIGTAAPSGLFDDVRSTVQDQLTDQIRQFISQQLVEMGASAEQPLGETLLVRDGFFCGRRFELGGFTAVWFIEENQIKFHHRDGSVIAVCSTEEGTPEVPSQESRQEQQRRAA